MSSRLSVSRPSTAGKRGSSMSSPKAPSRSITSSTVEEELQLADLNMLGGFEKMLPSDVDDTEALALLSTAKTERPDVFDVFGVSELKLLAQCMSILNLKEGESIVEQGEAATFFVIILSGTVDVLVDGVKTTQLSTGDIVGEMAFFEKGPRSASVVVASPEVLVGVTTFEEVNFLDNASEVLGNGVRFMLAQQSVRKLRKQLGKSEAIVEEQEQEIAAANSNSNSNNNNNSNGNDSRRLPPIEGLFQRRFRDMGKKAVDEIENAKKKEMKRNLNKSKQNVSALKRKVHMMTNKVDQYDALSKQFFIARDQLKQVMIKHEDLKEKERKALSSVKDLKKELDTTRRRGKADANSLHKKHEAAMTALSAEHKTQVDNLLAQVAAKELECEKIRAHTTELQRKHKQAEEHIVGHTDRNQDLSAQMNKEKQRVVSLEIRVQQLSSKNRNLVDENSQLRMQLQHQDTKMVVQTKQLETTEADLRQTVGHLREYKMKAAGSELMRQNESAMLSDRVAQVTRQFHLTVNVKEDYLRVIQALAARMFIRGFKLRKTVYRCIENLTAIHWVALEVEQDIKCSSVQESNLDELKERTKRLLQTKTPRPTKLLKELDFSILNLKTPLITLLRKLRTSANFFFTKNVQLTSEFSQAKDDLHAAQSTMHETLGLLGDKTRELENMQEEYEAALLRITKLEKLKDRYERIEQKQKLEEVRDAIFTQNYNNMARHTNRMETNRELKQRRTPKKKQTDKQAGKGGNNNNTPSKASLQASPLYTGHATSHKSQHQRPKSRQGHSRGGGVATATVADQKHQDALFNKPGWDWDKSREQLAQVGNRPKKGKKKGQHSMPELKSPRKQQQQDDDVDMEAWLNTKYKNKKLVMGDGWNAPKQRKKKKKKPL